MSNAKLYQAINEDSYKKLAAFMADTEYKVTLHPKAFAIVMGEDADKEAGEFIDELGLAFQVHPMSVYAENYGDVIDCQFTDAETLREIIYEMQEQKAADAKKSDNTFNTLVAQRDESDKEKERYYHNWQREMARTDRVKSQVRAIATLLGQIFPTD